MGEFEEEELIGFLELTSASPMKASSISSAVSSHSSYTPIRHAWHERQPQRSMTAKGMAHHCSTLLQPLWPLPALVSALAKSDVLIQLETNFLMALYIRPLFPRQRTPLWLHPIDHTE